MLTPAELLIDELACICEQAHKTDDITVLFPIAYEFTDKFRCNPLLKPFMEALIQDYNNDRASLDSEIKKIMNKMLPVCKAVITYIEKNGIKNLVIIQEVSQLQSHTELHASAIYMQYFALIRGLKHLLQDTITNHRDFIKKYAHINEANSDQPITLFFNLDEFAEELHYQGRMEKTKAWYSLGQLISLSIIYNPKMYEEQKSALRKNKQPISEWILQIRYDALKRAIDPGVDEKLREQGFRFSEYKGHMQRLYTHARKKLLSSMAIPEKESTKQPEYTYKYDSNTRVGVLSNGTATCILRGNAAALAHLVIKKKRIAEDDARNVMLSNEDASPKNQVKYARETINNAVLKKFLIPAFIGSDQGRIDLKYPVRLIK